MPRIYINININRVCVQVKVILTFVRITLLNNFLFDVFLEIFIAGLQCFLIPYTLAKFEGHHQRSISIWSVQILNFKLNFKIIPKTCIFGFDSKERWIDMKFDMHVINIENFEHLLLWSF